MRQRLDRQLSALVALCFFLGVVLNLSTTIASRTSWMSYVEDDFFYYLKIAENLAHGAGSTFNGLVPTNGYHPLWLLLLTALRLVTTSSTAVMVFLCLVMLLAYGATFFFSRSILIQAGGSPLISTALSVYISLNCLRLFVGGMEILLAIPLMLAVLSLAQQTARWQQHFWRACGLGLLLSAMGLSRLDSLLFAAMILAGILLHPALRQGLSSQGLLGLATGLLPVPLYLLCNRIFFRTWTPVSGMAKQLKGNHTLSLSTFHSIHGALLTQRTQMLGAILCLSAILLLPLVLARMTPIQQVLLPAALLFPLLYYGLLSFLSDWPLWEWYLYPLRVSLCVAFAILLLWPPTGRLLQHPATSLFAALVVMILSLTLRNPIGQEALMLDVAKQVRSFSTTHPGTYAMGDRSGIVGYLLPHPLVQTEGLVMDRAFLENIRQRRPLRETLASYNVRYYITTIYPPYPDGCVHVAEPYEAGPTSPKMAADLCEHPVAVFQQQDIRTLIYDLAPTAAGR